MNQINLLGIALLTTLFVLALPLNVQGQDQEKDYYTCQMHPEVKSDKPGKCPECGMFLVLASTLEKKEDPGKRGSGDLGGKEKALKAKALLAEAKEDLYYNCCLKNPCDRCALDHQSCTCYKDLQSGKGVCSDCYAGWQMGEGKKIPGISKDQVKLNAHHHGH